MPSENVNCRQGLSHRSRTQHFGGPAKQHSLSCHGYRPNSENQSHELKKNTIWENDSILNVLCLLSSKKKIRLLYMSKLTQNRKKNALRIGLGFLFFILVLLAIGSLGWPMYWVYIKTIPQTEDSVQQ